MPQSASSPVKRGSGTAEGGGGCGHTHKVSSPRRRGPNSPLAPAASWVPGQARDDTRWVMRNRDQHARPCPANPLPYHINPPFPPNLSPVLPAGVYCPDPPPTRTDVDGERRGGWTGRRGGIVPPVGSQATAGPQQRGLHGFARPEDLPTARRVRLIQITSGRARLAVSVPPSQPEVHDRWTRTHAGGRTIPSGSIGQSASKTALAFIAVDIAATPAIEGFS